MDPFPPEKAQALLDDARLMLTYASRMGRLPNRNVLAIIEKVETTKPTDGAYAHAVSELLAAVDQLARAIKPIQLSDLNPNWTPFPQHRLDPMIRPVVAILATVLIAALGYATLDYTRARGAVSAITELQTEEIAGQPERLFDHWNLVKSNLPPSSAAQQDQSASYYHEMEVVQRLQDRIDANTGLADRLARDPAMFFVGLTRARPAEAPSAPGKAAQLVSLDLSTNQISAAYDNRADYKPFDTSTAPPANTAAAYNDEFVQYLVGHGLGGLYADENSNLQSLLAKSLRDCSDIVAVYGLWVLPALYGLFGALVYHLRTMMNPHVATPNLLAARWALAMMAGVSISWVFNNVGDRPGGVTVFGLAFLFGYSIDVFFSALDRVVAQLSHWTPKSA